jgi:hypothetical protein
MTWFIEAQLKTDKHILFYAHIVGQMVNMAYSRASWTMKKPLDQEEKDQIFNLVDEIRSEIRVI